MGDFNMSTSNPILSQFLDTCTFYFNPLSANPTKWSNTLKQLVGKLPTNCLSVLDYFVGMALKGLNIDLKKSRIHQALADKFQI